MHSVLLIRPLEDALPLANALRLKGIEPCIYPLFEPYFFPLSPLTNPQALIITSKNALRAIKEQENLKQTPLYVVGDQTAELANELGFSNVFNASGNSQDLISLILQKARREEGILWYLSGEIIKTNIIEELRTKGFQAERQVVYGIKEIENVPLSFLSKLKEEKISHAMFFSPHTTTLFVNILKRHGLEKTTEKMTSLCLSQAIADKASALRWKKIWVSPKPTTKHMKDYFNEE